MKTGLVIRGRDDVSTAWLAQVLKQRVDSVSLARGSGSWSDQWAIRAHMSDGTTRALRLKICLGDTFGRSEVDYYTRDYVDMANPPLVRCFDAQHDPGVGYHVLLEDLSSTHTDHRDRPPTLAHGLAVAEALGRLHRHHWGSRPAPAPSALNRYFDQIRPGLAAMERATACALRQGFERHEQSFRGRWADPQGMSLLHGDLNPTNILTPAGEGTPPYFLDRQPFDWSLTYGVAVSDLAYFMIPWWPVQTRQASERAVLRCWYDTVGAPGYSWSDAQADWRLSVEQCLDVPMQWCSRPATLDRMRGLWETQFARVQQALDASVESDRAED